MGFLSKLFGANKDNDGSYGESAETKNRMSLDDLTCGNEASHVEPSSVHHDGDESRTVILDSFGCNKIAVIKVVRGLTGLGLKEAKELVESAPTVLARFSTHEEATDACDQLLAVGASARVEGFPLEHAVSEWRGLLFSDAPEDKIVVIESFGGNKIAVIKVVRELTGMGLKEAKEFVESLPHELVFPTLSKARRACSKLVSAGATAHVVGSEEPIESFEQPVHRVVIESLGRNKIAVIKVVRGLTGMGLKEAKEFVETLPHELTFSTALEASRARKEFEEAGASAYIA